MTPVAEQQIDDWSQALRSAPVGQRFLVRGGGTKPSLLTGTLDARIGSSLPSGTGSTEHGRSVAESGRSVAEPSGGPPQALDTRGLSGIIEYRPAEFTITAYAGTPVSVVLETLAEHRQYLPFESPFHVATGPEEGSDELGRSRRGDLANRTTIGGLVAAGINGPGRLRHGGLRDFILEVRYLDGDGAIRRGGRRVVKNAAGFDIPKLLVGSCGRLGVILDVTFKVFPKPLDYLTLRVMSENIDSTVEIIATLTTHPWDLDALEVQPDGSVLIRLAGHSDALVKHGQRIQSRLSKYYSSFLTGPQQHQAWTASADWLWGEADHAVARVPVSLRGLFDLDESLDEMEIERAYGSGGNVAWLRWLPSGENPGTRLKRLHKCLCEVKCCGQVIQGLGLGSWLGAFPGQAFYQHLKNVFDPRGRLGNF